MNVPKVVLPLGVVHMKEGKQTLSIKEGRVYDRFEEALIHIK